MTGQHGIVNVIVNEYNSDREFKILINREKPRDINYIGDLCFFMIFEFGYGFRDIFLYGKVEWKIDCCVDKKKRFFSLKFREAEVTKLSLSLPISCHDICY